MQIKICIIKTKNPIIFINLSGLLPSRYSKLNKIIKILYNIIGTKIYIITLCITFFELFIIFRMEIELKEITTKENSGNLARNFGN